MKLTKSKLKRIIKEELNKVLESNEMVYGGATDELVASDPTGTVEAYLSVMRAYVPGARNENVTQTTAKGEKHMIEVLKLMWEFMRVNTGNTGAGEEFAMKDLGFNEFDAKEAVKRTNGINSTSPTGDMMMNAAVAKGPGEPDARGLPGGAN